MATSTSSEEDELIKCSICLEIYKNPKYLPCLHTFCETCLGAYIASVLKLMSTNGGSKKGFNCPICRTFVNVSNIGETSTEELAKSFPSNYLIVTLIDQKRLIFAVKTCDPCMASGETKSTATTWCTKCNEALCDNCDKSHRGLKLTRHHQIVLIDQVKSDHTFITTLDKCSSHKAKSVEFFCVDHDMECCSTCVTVNHRKCDHVQTLEEAAIGSRSEISISDLSKSFDEMTSVYDRIKDKRKLNLQDLETSKYYLKQKVLKFREDIIKHLDQWNEAINGDLEKLHGKCTSEIEGEIMELESAKSITENCHRVAASCLQNASDIHKFLEIRKLKKHKEKQENLLKTKLKSLIKISYKLDLDTEFLSVVDKLPLVDVSKTTQICDTISVLKDCRFVSFQTEKECVAKQLITATGTNILPAGILLQDGKMLFSDYGNKRLLVYDVNGRLHKYIHLPGEPWGISLTDTQTAAVTLHSERIIQFIDVVALTTGKQIQLEGLYTGIAFNDEHIIAGTSTGIAMLDNNGSVINKITTGCSSPQIAAYKNKIFYSASGHLQCCDTSGKHIFTYSNSNLTNVHGISFDYEGNIYVGGYDSHNIHQLNADGDLIKIILTSKDGIDNPRGITINQNTNKMLVTHGNNKVTIFERLNS